MNSEKWNKIDLFIGTEDPPLKNYEQFLKKLLLINIIIVSLYLLIYLIYLVHFIQKY